MQPRRTKISFPLVLAIGLLQLCGAPSIAKPPLNAHAIGFYDLDKRLRMALFLPGEFSVDPKSLIGCEVPTYLDGILSCAPHKEGNPLALGYFDKVHRGILVSGWISVRGKISGPDEILAGFRRGSVVKVISSKKVAVDGHEAVMADLEDTSQKNGSTARYQRWVMFKLKNMAGGITFSEYQGPKLKISDLDSFGANGKAGARLEQWELGSVIDEIVARAKIFLPNE